MLLLGAGIGVLISVLYYALRPDQTPYLASASVVVRDPQSIAEPDTLRPERFVANQVQIMRSFAVASEASKILADTEGVLPVAPLDLMESSVIEAQETSDQIVIEVETEDEATAVAAANALVEAFRTISRDESEVASQSALERIDAQLSSIDTRLTRLGVEMGAIESQDALLARLQIQMDAALVRIADLQDDLAATSDEEDRAAILQSINSLRQSISVYQEAVAARGASPALAALLVEQEQLINRRAALLERRDSVSVEAVLDTDAIDFSSPASFATPTGLDAGRAMGVGFVLGGLGAAGLVVVRASGRGRIDEKLVPETILRAPLLAEIPDFLVEESFETLLPVRDAPRTASAEAFRFAATSLERILRERDAKSVLVTSSTTGHGKTVVMANLLLAIARRGLRVVAVDADFGNQELTATLTGGQGLSQVGLSEVLTSDLRLNDAIVDVYSAPDVSFGLLSRGSQNSVATDILRQPRADGLFRSLAESNDLVLIDGPPFLQVAYTTTLSSYVDAVVVVVNHGSRRKELLDLKNRLDLSGTQVVGYIYNRAPLSPDMTSSGGSMKDVLGDVGLASDVPLKRRRRATEFAV